MNNTENSTSAEDIAVRWCASKGHGWSVQDSLGKGGTAPVFEVISPNGLRALKIYDERFSTGEIGKIEAKRIDQQLALKGHDCPYLVQPFDGGKFDDRLFLLMDRAPGQELEKKLKFVPRNKIRQIVDQVARAAMYLDGRNLCHRDIKAANVYVSDDFAHCTLLDISVVRDIYDPIGIGTDHDGELPVVATARYSPPEYLFRLLEPGRELWHALNVYQLGALLHDLIMREPLFQAEYQKSAQNRYRFAWIVATMTPSVAATDVDQDLVLVAQRALDKDWKRRCSLGIKDFLADSNIRQGHALQLLGLGLPPPISAGDGDLTSRIQRVTDASRALDDALTIYLKERGVTAKHEIEPGPHDTSRKISFHWTLLLGGRELDVELALTLYRYSAPMGPHFGLSIELSTIINGKKTEDRTELPEVLDHPEIESVLTRQAIAAFENLALKIMRTDAN